MQTINSHLTLDYSNNLNEEFLKNQIKQFSDKCRENIFSMKQKEIEFYIKILKPYILFHPLYWYTNPLVKLIKEHVGNELPTCFLNYIKEIEEDPDFQNAIRYSIENYYNLILRNEDINEEQIQELLAIIEIDSSLKETIVNFIIFKILTQKLNLSDQIYIDILLYFFQIFKENSKEDFYIMTKAMPDIIVKNQRISINAKAKIKFGHQFIVLNSRTLKCSNIFKNLFVFFHEFWHTIQDRDDITPIQFREMFDMDEYLKNSISDYENNNYEALSYESDANLNALILLYQYLKSINFNEYDNILKQKIEYYRAKRNNNIRINSFGFEITLEEYFYQATQNLEQKIRPN